MKSLWTTFILIFLISTNTLADDVYLTNGQAIINCQVKDTVGNQVRIITTQRTRSIPIYSISRIVILPFILTTETEIVGENDISVRKDAKTGVIVRYNYPNTYLLPVSAIAFGLAWDYFAQASDIQDIIDGNNKLPQQYQIDNSKYESQKSRKTILGVVFLAAGVINTIYAFKKVEITASDKLIGLTYKF